MRRVSRSLGIYIAAMAVILAVLTAIGCGGSEGDGRLTVEEYQAESLDVRDEYASVYERFVVGAASTSQASWNWRSSTTSSGRS